MYESICGKWARKRSHRAAHVPKWHLLEKAIPLFLPLQIPQTQFYKVVHDYTIDAESLVFSMIFRTWLRCILQGKTRPHKFEPFPRCQVKGDPAAVVAAGSLVISRGLGDFGAERVFSIGCVFDGFKTVFFRCFYTRIYTRKVGGGAVTCSRRPLQNFSRLLTNSCSPPIIIQN